MRMLGTVISVALAAALAAWTFTVTAPRIQSDVDARAEAAVEAAGLGEVAVATDGRRPRLEGVVESEEERRRLIDAAAGVRGALAPEDALTILPRLAPYPFGATRSADGAVRVAGAAPTAADQAAFIEAARARFGAAADIDITLAAGAPDDWATRVVAALDAAAALQSGTVALEGDAARLEGVVGDEAAFDAAGRAADALAAAAPSGLARALEIDPARVAPYVLTVEGPRDGAPARISGYAPSLAARAALTAAAERAFGAPPAGALALASGDIAPNWAERVAAALPLLARAEAATLTAVDDALSFSGAAATPEDADALKAEIALTDPTIAVDIAARDPRRAGFFTVEKTAEGATLAGRLPSGVAREEAAALLGLGASSLTPALVAEDGRGDAATWRAELAALGAALAGFDALEARIDLDGATLLGVASREGAVEAVTRLAAASPRAMALDLRFEPSLLEPFVTRIEKTAAGARAVASGAAPSAEARAALAEDGRVDSGALTLAGGAPQDWLARLSAALPALDAVDAGVLTLTDGRLALSGSVATPEASAAAQAAIAALGLDIAAALTPLDARPLAGATAARAAGAETLWRGAAPTGSSLGAPELEATGRGDAAAWDAAAAALAVLEARFERFTLTIAPDGAATLDGLARDAAALDALRAAAPASWRLGDVAVASAPEAPRIDMSLGGVDGVTLSGLLPEGLSPDEARRLLGAPNAGGALATGGAGDPAVWRARLAAIGELLPEFETLEARIETDAARIAGALSPTSDQTQVAALLRGGLGAARADIALSEATAPSVEGAERTNPLNGQPEVMRNGYWLPKVEVSGAGGCQRASDLVLFDNEIRFRFNASELDLRAREVVNALAAIAIDCLTGDAALVGLEIGGHADSIGDTAYNLRLSEARAAAVLQALLERGAPAERLRSVGYGESRPIAKNATEAGRAANRRISFQWLQ